MGREVTPPNGPSRGKPTGELTLTSREHGLLALVADRLSNNEIAARPVIWYLPLQNVNGHPVLREMVVDS